eukprot:Opistho-2@49383
MRRAREETEDDEDEEEEEEAMIAEVTGSGMAHGHADGTGDAQRADGTGDAQRDDDAASRAKRRRIAAAHASGASSAADTASADAFGCVEAAVASAEQLARDAPRRCAVGIVTEAHFSMGRTRAAHDGARSSHVIDGDGRRRRFMARIDPSANAACEDELRRSIDKGAFDGMDVIGQFNMGFIIARLGRDLFIVDQHATDEKYNFEELERTTQLCPQPLICPQPLELTAAAEGVLLEHLSVFRQNGFEFLVDADAPVTKRVMLAAVPQSKGTSFGPAGVYMCVCVFVCVCVCVECVCLCVSVSVCVCVGCVCLCEGVCVCISSCVIMNQSMAFYWNMFCTDLQLSVVAVGKLALFCVSIHWHVVLMSPFLLDQHTLCMRGRRRRNDLPAE